MNFAPICLFTYNRLSETQQTIKALRKNYLSSESELFIFSDGPKNREDKYKVDQLRSYLDTINGFSSVKIFKSKYNKGLANSIISGVTHITSIYDKAIVLEDDLVTSANYLDFMNQALDYYESKKRIKSINGFSLFIGDEFEVYFQQRPFSWGWATWSDRWHENIFDKSLIKNEINRRDNLLNDFKEVCGDDIVKMLKGSIENENDSWYVRWAFNHFLNDKYSVYPSNSFIENIGFGENGTHCKGINPYSYKMSDEEVRKFVFREFKKPGKEEIQKFLKYFKKIYRLKIRLNLLSTRNGRKKLMNELKNKFPKA